MSLNARFSHLEKFADDPPRSPAAPEAADVFEDLPGLGDSESELDDDFSAPESADPDSPLDYPQETMQRPIRRQRLGFRSVRMPSRRQETRNVVFPGQHGFNWSGPLSTTMPELDPSTNRYDQIDSPGNLHPVPQEFSRLCPPTHCRLRLQPPACGRARVDVPL